MTLGDAGQQGSAQTSSRSWGAVRVTAVACIVVAIATVVIQAPRAISKLGARASRSASFNFDDREFAVGNSIIPDKQLLNEARATIPVHGGYRVVTGRRPIEGATDLTLPYAGTFATYFLMPRRPLPSARWIICLGCDPAQLGQRVKTVWTDDHGSSLLRVQG